MCLQAHARNCLSSIRTSHMQLSDRFTGLFLIALGGVAAYGGSRLPPVPGQQVGPNVFPMVVGAGLILCGALIALGIGRHFEDEAEADLAAHSAQEPAAQGARGWWRGLMALVPPGLLLFYVFAVDRLGFLRDGCDDRAHRVAGARRAAAACRPARDRRAAVRAPGVLQAPAGAVAARPGAGAVVMRT